MWDRLQQWRPKPMPSNSPPSRCSSKSCRTLPASGLVASSKASPSKSINLSSTIKKVLMKVHKIKQKFISRCGTIFPVSPSRCSTEATRASQMCTVISIMGLMVVSLQASESYLQLSRTHHVQSLLKLTREITINVSKRLSSSFIIR